MQNVQYLSHFLAIPLELELIRSKYGCLDPCLISYASFRYVCRKRRRELSPADHPSFVVGRALPDDSDRSEMMKKGHSPYLNRVLSVFTPSRKLNGSGLLRKILLSFLLACRSIAALCPTQ